MPRIIGLGTGRCGTRSLAALLRMQDDVCCEHERAPQLSWEGDPDPARHVRDYPAGYAAVADVGFYYLPYVEELLYTFADLACICLKRDREGTVESFIRQTRGGLGWFSDTTGRWAGCFPTYPGHDFRTQVGMYWDEYYERAHALECDRFRVFNTRELNTVGGVERLLSFAGLPLLHVKAGIQINDFGTRQYAEVRDG